MENALSCDICMLPYSSSALPKMLNCGHSFCLFCIKKFIEGHFPCPNCKQKLDKDDPIKYPTNYALLSASEVYEDEINHFDSRFLESIQAMKTKYEMQMENLELRKAEIISKIDYNLELITKGLDKIRLLCACEIKDMKFQDTVTVLKELAADYKKIESNMEICTSNLKESVSIKLSSYEEYEEYLLTIYRKVKNGERIFSVLKIEDSVKYGKISVLDNKILFHSLCISEKPSDSTFIWFNDLKENCSTTKKLFPFLELTCNESEISRKVIIEMWNSQKVTQFVKLCTGECGASYKDCQFVKGTNHANFQKVLYVGNYQKFGALCSGNIEYYLDYSLGKLCKNSETIIFGEISGSFSIVKMNCAIKHSNAVGKIISPSDLSTCISYDTDPSKLKIVDCGILFYIE